MHSSGNFAFLETKMHVLLLLVIPTISLDYFFKEIEKVDVVAVCCLS